MIYLRQEYRDVCTEHKMQDISESITNRKLELSKFKGFEDDDKVTSNKQRNMDWNYFSILLRTINDIVLCPYSNLNLP